MIRGGSSMAVAPAGTSHSRIAPAPIIAPSTNPPPRLQSCGLSLAVTIDQNRKARILNTGPAPSAGHDGCVTAVSPESPRSGVDAGPITSRECSRYESATVVARAHALGSATRWLIGLTPYSLPPCSSAQTRHI
jgi:hypothetical protein